MDKVPEVQLSKSHRRLSYLKLTCHAGTQQLDRMKMQWREKRSMRTMELLESYKGLRVIS